MLEATNSIPEGGPEEKILNEKQFISMIIFGSALFLAVLFILIKTKFYSKNNRDNDKMEI